MLLHPQGVTGPWQAGIVLDWHTVASQIVGHNEFGHPVFDSIRSDIGELLYQFKYHGSTGALQQILTTAIGYLADKARGKFDLVIPVPPSNSQRMVTRQLAYGLAAGFNTGFSATALSKCKRTSEAGPGESSLRAGNHSDAGASMSKVFLGGSRRLARLNESIKARLLNLISGKHTILIGDANGVDRSVQAFFNEQNYRDVLVYCMDALCRNNLGSWPVKSIGNTARKRDFAYYAAKDQQMSLDADYGFMIWDGASQGTLNNVLNLRQQGKLVLVYHSPAGEFVQIRSANDVLSLVAACPLAVLDHLNKKIKLDKRVAPENQLSLGV